MFNFFRRKQQSSSEGDLPISEPDLKALFDHLDRPDPDPCTHTMRETEAFLRARGLPVESTLRWLASQGAGCDCEVIFNVDAEWGERVGREPPPDDDDAE